MLAKHCWIALTTWNNRSPVTTGGFIRLELDAGDARGNVRLSIGDSGGRLAATPVPRLFTQCFSTKKGGPGPGETRFDTRASNAGG